MYPLAEIFVSLSSVTSEEEKEKALIRLLHPLDSNDMGWVLYFLFDKRFKRLASKGELKEIFFELSPIDRWVFEESLLEVGNIPETISLLLNGGGKKISISSVMEELTKMGISSAERREFIKSMLMEFDLDDRLTFLKLLSGEMKLNVEIETVAKALSSLFAIDSVGILERLSDFKSPSDYSVLRSAAGTQGPYAFKGVGELPAKIDISSLHFEWKLPGIRAQLVKREKVNLWSKGPKLLTRDFTTLIKKYQNYQESFVLDGVIVQSPETRFIAFDILELNAKDLRGLSLHDRRDLLKDLLSSEEIAPSVVVKDLEELLSLGKNPPKGFKGIIAKETGSSYKREDWYLIERAPIIINAVLMYAFQDRREEGFTYTFGVWKDGNLAPLATVKGASYGDAKDLDQWIRKNTLRRFGPTRALRFERVFSLRIDDIERSRRYKSGLLVHKASIIREEQKRVEEADSVLLLEETV